MEQIKEKILKAVESSRAELLRLSHEVHDRPELALTEHYAAERTAALLRSRGYEMKIGVGGLETAFLATKEVKSGGTAHCIFGGV